MSDELRQVGKHYDKVDFIKGPAIYSSAELYDAMYNLGFFFSRTEPFLVMDAMCGKGLAGKEMSTRLKRDQIPHEMHFLDVGAGNLKKLKAEGYKTCLASVTDRIPYDDGALDRLYCRFGVKNYPKVEQEKILREFLRLLKKGDIFVLTDMEAPETAYDWMQAERKMKHIKAYLGGVGGNTPHIPTRKMWYQMLADSGFEPKGESETVSYVTTDEWVKSNQMTEDALREMNTWLLKSPENAKRALNIREENGKVRIDYPVVVISAAVK